MLNDTRKKSFDLLDLYEEDVLKRLQKRFSDLFGFNVAFTGLNCRQIGEQDRNYIVGTTCEILKEREKKPEDICHLCDKEAGKIAKEKGWPILYRCYCYCSNFVIPIKVMEEVIGYVFSGQFFAQEPGHKSPQQWENLLFHVPKQDQEKEKKRIHDKERTEWDTFVYEGDFINLRDDGKYVKQDFFQKPEYEPSKRELLEVARAANLPFGEYEKFIRVFNEKSKPHNPGNRVKEATDIIRDIKILSEVANTISEEWTSKYALRTYINIHEDSKATTGRWVLRNRGSLTEIRRNLQELSKKIQPFIAKSRDSSQERTMLAKEIAEIAGSIYQKLLRLEAKWVLSDAKAISFLCWHKRPEKRFIKDLLNSNAHVAAKENEDVKLSEQNDRLRGALTALREKRKKIREKLNVSRTASVWGLTTTAIGAILTFFFGPVWGIGASISVLTIVLVVALLYALNWGE